MVKVNEANVANLRRMAWMDRIKRQNDEQNPRQIPKDKATPEQIREYKIYKKFTPEELQKMLVDWNILNDPETGQPIAQLDKLPSSAVQLIGSLSEELNVAYEFVHLLSQLIYTEPLTELHNNYALIEVFDKAQKNGEKAVLVVFDLNLLHTINEKYGRKTGNEALKLLAHTMTKNRIQHSDLMRITGDEFAVVIRGVTKEQVEQRYVPLIERALHDNPLMLPSGKKFHVGVKSACHQIKPDDDLDNVLDKLCNVVESRRATRNEMTQAAMSIAGDLDLGGGGEDDSPNLFIEGDDPQTPPSSGGNFTGRVRPQGKNPPEGKTGGQTRSPKQ